MKKTAVMITCFEFYEKRMLAAGEQLSAMGYDIISIESDFRHLQRERRSDKRHNLFFIHTIPYHRNLSCTRIISHYRFARAALKKAETFQPDLLYVVVPPNSLIKETAAYKKRHPHAIVIFDVLDLWPETLPMKKLTELFPYRYWRSLRNQYIDCADHIFTECDLFHRYIEGAAAPGKISTLYLSRQIRPYCSELALVGDRVILAYLGSINNIIDIPRICDLVRALSAKKPVTVHVIGNGEKKGFFLDELKNAGADVEFYGELYDIDKKQKIFDQCHFGINILKESVCIGLTMKSIDYFECGLPVINTLGADTAAMIERYDVGIPYAENAEKTAELVINSLEGGCITMRNNCRNLFEMQFSLNRFEADFYQGMDGILVEEKNECR